MKPLKVFAIGAEMTVISTLAVSSYHVAFSGGGGASDWLAGAPILTVVALESLRLPIAFNLPRTRLLGMATSVAMLTGLSVITGEAASLAFENLIFQRTRPVVEAERDLTKAENDRVALKEAADLRAVEIARLTADVETAQNHRVNTDKPPELLPPPAQQPSPVLQPIPPDRTCTIRTGKHIVTQNCGAPAQEAARKANSAIQDKVVEANKAAQDEVDKANAATMGSHAAELKTADDQIKEAVTKLAAVAPAPDMHVSDASLAEAKRRVTDTRAANPMFRVAAAWQRTPVEELTSEQFEVVKHWAVIALAVATAFTTALAAVISSLPERDSRPSKVARMARAWLARRRKPIVVHQDVPGPVEYQEKIVYQDVPGPETIKEVEVVKEVPGPERIVEKEVIKEVRGPIEYRPAPGPIEYRDVPGPERVVERVVVKWVPYDVTTGLRIKSDGSLGEVAQMRSAQ